MHHIGCEQPRFLNPRFCLVQIAYWFENCAVCSFAALYLLQYGFTYAQAGLLIALANLLTCALQPLMGAFVDRMTRFSLKQVIYAFAALGVMAGMGLELASSLAGVFALYMATTILTITVQPLLNVLGVAHGKRVNFGLARGVGSVAYGASAAFIGLLVSGIGPTLIDDVIIACWIAIALAVLAFPLAEARDPEAREHAADEPTPTRAFPRAYRLFCLVLAGCFLLMFSHYSVAVFLITIVEHAGGGQSDFGIATAVAACIELPVMASYVVLRRRVSCELVLAASGFAFLARMLTLWLAPTVTLIFAAQLVQALSFGLYVPAIVEYANRVMRPADTAKGQALVTTANTLGLALASLIGGVLLDTIGLPAVMATGSAAAAAGAIVVAALLVRRPRKDAAGGANDPVADAAGGGRANRPAPLAPDSANPEEEAPPCTRSSS
ncbi:MFS transporter [Arabiibacter massiliensis]|uniref:MFS transporter n=1 Tax=Arabiibacter massiliensis TaxID=1870985 RepID=UPI0009BA2474|nr:MFS transporter [Arabiibacter massiliensis]